MKPKSDSSDGNSDISRSSLIKQRFTSALGRRRPGSRGNSGNEQTNSESPVKGPLGLQLLHASPEPLIDLIFVHGLKGDSIKTWRKGGDPLCFWPQLWLPTEPGFENVNIHTFGYDSNWSSSKSTILDIHDFGQGLLEEMRNAPQLRDNVERPIILLGHSMGGLVIKKAFILAQDVPDFKSRIRSIFFLSTPHRGNDFASILNNILTVSGFLSPRHYLADITTGSPSLQLINDNFSRYAHSLPIFSFYETLKMTIGISSIMVVDRDSAVLGHQYKNERVQFMDANHRDVCKFSNVDDPNYNRVRNALASAVGEVLKDLSMIQQAESKEQMLALQSYLGVPEFSGEHHSKVNGSCQWIEAREDFQDWRDCSTEYLPDAESTTESHNLAIFWLHASLGTGKTVLASHVVSQLRDFQLECAYYYFESGNKFSASLGSFLRSIAYQMAMTNSAIRSQLCKLHKEDSTYNMEDSQAIWAKIYKKGIFQSQIRTPQYWIIDALDECSNYQELFTMLKGEDPNFPLRILITSRKVHDIHRLQQALHASAMLTCIEISGQDSISDIELYIQSRIGNLSIDSNAEREEIASKILRKSNACFLWVRLVLDELDDAYSRESIMTILERIPNGMIPYYERTVTSMVENKLEKHITKAVLLWTVTCARKLTISELSQALKLDLGIILPNVKSAVEGLCGQLVVVDEDSGIVELVHPTAREFLVSSAGQFTISMRQAHERVALVCLRILSSNELRPPRNRRFLAHARPAPTPLLDYAITQLSGHIQLASQSDELVAMMEKFFKTNVLSWIERLALKNSLHCLVQASRDLASYLGRRTTYQSTLGDQAKHIVKWSIDLSRLVTQFGEAMLQDPTSIYFLIPPLCPDKSVIHQQFGTRSEGLTIVGAKRPVWEDCVAYVNFGEDIATAIACGEDHIAVGMESGDVNVYNHRSWQKEAIIRHKSPVDLVHLSDDFVVSCTTRAIVMQDLDGNTLWEKRLRFRCLLLTSFDNFIIAVSQHSHVLKWDKITGEQIDDHEFPFKNYDIETAHNSLASRAPEVASISPDMETLALGYRGGSVCLWDVRERDLVGWARDEKGRLAVKLLFNPNPSINLLLVIYSDHGLALYDSWSGNLVHSHSALSDAGLLSASCSPDGRTLVTTDSLGNMVIWNFDTLSVLYHIHSPFPSFRILGFTSDGSNIVDVMDSAMRIWSPTVLDRANEKEDSSASDVAIRLATTEHAYKTRKSKTVTALCAHPTSGIVFAGKYGGEIVAFATNDDKPTAILYSHSHTAFIKELAVTKDNIIASSDVDGLVQVWSLSSTAMQRGTLRIKIHATAPVRQLLFSAEGNYLLVSTTESDTVYHVEDGACVGTWSFEPHERKSWRWLLISHHAAEDQHFSLFADGMIRSYAAQSFPGRVDDSEVNVHYAYDEDVDCVETGVKCAIFIPSTGTLVLEIWYDTGLASFSTLFLFDLNKVNTSSGSPLTTTLTPLSPTLSKRCKHFLGFSDFTKSFVFIHQDSWFSSVDVPGIQEMRYTRHFFVPKDYLTSSEGILPMKTVDDDLVFSGHGELVSVRNGMKFSTARPLE